MEKNNCNKNKVEYVWVINEPCEVVLELSNPLNFELEITNIVSKIIYTFLSQVFSIIVAMVLFLASIN